MDLAACPAACLGAEPDLADAACKECFCTQALRDKQIMENKDACQDYFLNFIVSIVAEYLPSVAIVTSNIVLKVIVRRTAQYEHHHSLSGEQTSKAYKLFLAQLLNMGVSPLIANARLPGAAALVEGTPVEGYVLSGGFDDLTAKWYTDVGRSLVITIALTSVTRPLLVYLKFWKAWLTKKRAPAALTQRVMNKMLEGPDFELAERYGEVMNLIFVAFLYSTAMPLVYALLALSLGLQYLMEKYELLKLCKKPPAYTADLALMTANTLPYALLGHFLLGIWALSSFPDKQSSLVAGFATYWGMAKDLWLEHVGVTRKRLFERVMQRNAALLTLLLLAFLVFLVLKAILGTLVRVLLLIFRGTGDEAEGNASFDAVVRSRLLTGAASYSILVNTKYSAALATDNVDRCVLAPSSPRRQPGRRLPGPLFAPCPIARPGRRAVRLTGHGQRGQPAARQEQEEEGGKEGGGEVLREPERGDPGHPAWGPGPRRRRELPDGRPGRGRPERPQCALLAQPPGPGRRHAAEPGPVGPRLGRRARLPAGARRPQPADLGRRLRDPAVA